MALDLIPTDQAQLDLVSLGECMVRLSPPGHDRIEFARTMDVYVGGGEFNVAYALARLGLRTGWVGGLVDNPVSAIIENHARSVGMDVSHAPKLPYDGVGRDARIGLNFTEVGVGPRAAVTLYDRGHSATSKMTPDSVDWKKLFSGGVRWLHTGGIFTCLSDTTRQVTPVALQAAKDAGTIVSYDLNFRSKLWSSEEAISHTKPLAPYIDCLIGNEEDFEKVLGYEVEGADVEGGGELPIEKYKDMVRRVVQDYPNLKVVGTTLREVVSASENNWSALLYFAEDDTFYQGPTFERLILEDRVGGGDGFASGFAYAFLNGHTPQEAVNLGTAHGALLQTTRGDASQITLKELLHTAGGGGARIVR